MAVEISKATTECLPPHLLTREEKIRAINNALAQFSPAFMDVTHTITAGVYTRTGKIRKGEIIVGTKHKAENVFTLYRGKILVWDADNGVRCLTAPYTEITPPGRQRIGLAIEETEGCNIFKTDATTWQAAEKEMLCDFTLPENCGELVMKLSEKISA